MSGSGARIVAEVLDAWREDDRGRTENLLTPGAGAAMERAWKPGFEPDETHEAGENVVVVGRSTADLDTRKAWRFGLREGVIAHAEAHSDPATALEAAGLAGSTGRDVDLIRRHYAAFNRDDLEAIVATLHPEVEIFVNDERGAVAQRFSGREEARGFFTEMKELVADNHVEVLSLDATPGRVELSVRLSGTLRSSERSGSLPAVHYFTFRDELIARIDTYRPDWRAAL